MNFRFNLRKLNKKGSAIVTVIMAIALVSLLVSVMLTTSYLNYKMKVTEIKSKDTFYSAETILDEISIGLQGMVSEALSNAYLEVFTEYSDYPVDAKNERLENLYYNKLYDKLAGNYTYTTYKLSELIRFVTADPWNNTTKTGYRITSSTSTMVTYSNLGIVLEDIEVYYRDANGRSSTITTDIRLCKPSIDFGAVTAVPNINDYVVIADDTLNIVADSMTTKLSGNIYGGTINASSSSTGTIELSSDEFIVAKHNINIDKATVKFPSAASEIWATDLNITGASVSVDGSLNLQDDINIKGNGSSFKLTNKLNAFGTSTTDSSRSSSIIINGTNASLDFTGAEMVTIAGHAFINTRKVNYGAVGGTSVGNGSNVYTGESISVKSNQIMYLIPGECIGVNKAPVTDESGAVLSYSYGTSKFNQNPITAAQYSEINNSGYEMVLTNRIVESLGHPLSDYIDYTTSGVVVPKYETVFVQTNGETMVYFYMTFANENKANQYFNDYYRNNAEVINEYLNFYVNNIVVPDARNMVRLQVAGHFLTRDDSTGNIAHRENTVSNASAKLGSSDTIYAREKDALSTKLIANYSDLGNVFDNDLSHAVVFDNLIDTTYWSTVMSAYSTVKFYDNSYDYVVVITDNPDYHYTGSDDYSGKPVRLIVSSGDVHVDRNFEGLILAKGNIYVANGISVTAKPDEVALTFWYQNLNETDESKRFFVYNIFRDGSGIARNSSGIATSTQSLSLTDLVVYENWSRR